MTFPRKLVELMIIVLNETNCTPKNREISLVSYVESEFCIFIHVMQMT